MQNRSAVLTFGYQAYYILSDKFGSLECNSQFLDSERPKVKDQGSRFKMSLRDIFKRVWFLMSIVTKPGR